MLNDIESFFTFYEYARNDLIEIDNNDEIA